MKRILLLTNMYPSASNPTYGIFVKQTYNWLAEKYDVTLVKIAKQKFFLGKFFIYMVFYLKSIFWGLVGKYDLVYAHFISHSALPVWIIKFFHPKIIVIGNIHGEDVFFQYEKFQKNKKHSEVFLKKADFIISPSLYYKNRLAKEYTFPEKNIFVSPSGGVDIRLFKPLDSISSKEKMNLNLAKNYIGFASRLEKGKGCDVLINAFSELKHPDCMLLIVGNGSEERQLKTLVQKLSLSGKVVFFPLLPHEKLTHFYNSLDVFCFPSERESESLGLVGLEAMACGTLCVVSDNFGIMTYAVDGQNAIVFEKSNEKDLALKLKKALSLDSEQKQKIKSNARQTGLEYSSDKTKKEFLNFFNEVLKI